ncbi:hypothetical protein CRUP_019689 [Coryphaenoides rupestris]|nr:hypothetical protein CRUP_019689 [Coryphaenoides rupestris]
MRRKRRRRRRRRTRRRRRKKRRSDEDEPTRVKKSKQKAKKPKTKSPRRPKPRPSINREVSNEFRPSLWITDVVPRKSPFVPQMGDEVIYFRQGHEAYVEAVNRNELYPINLEKQPWKKMALRLTLIDHGTGKISDQVLLRQVRP